MFVTTKELCVLPTVAVAPCATAVDTSIGSVTMLGQAPANLSHPRRQSQRFPWTGSNPGLTQCVNPGDAGDFAAAGRAGRPGSFAGVLACHRPWRRGPRAGHRAWPVGEHRIPRPGSRLGRPDKRLALRYPAFSVVKPVAFTARMAVEAMSGAVRRG